MDDHISRAAIIRAVEENPFVTDSVKSFVRCSARNIPAADVVPWEWLERYAAEKRLTLASVFVAQAREMYEERIHCGYVRGERDD